MERKSEEVERLYGEFDRYMDDKKINEAYKILLEENDIIQFMTLAEAGTNYAELSNYDREYGQVFKGLVDRVISNWEKDSLMIDILKSGEK